MSSRRQEQRSIESARRRPASLALLGLDTPPAPILLGALLAGSLLSLACGGGEPEAASAPGASASQTMASGSTAAPAAPRSGGPHLLFIVSDTLRGDAVDCELHRDRTPNLCDLADRGVFFENAYVGGPWTLPSSVALFTGNHATSYGQLAPGSAADWSQRDQFFHIDDDQVLLADALAAMGYETLRFNETRLPEETNAFQGLEAPELDGRKFTRALRQAYPEMQNWSGGRLPLHDRGVLSYLATREDRSFYMLFWMIDPHAPYRPSEADREEAAEGLESLRFPVPFYTHLGHQDAAGKGRLLLRDYGPYSDDEVRLLVRFYLAEVRGVDQRIGRIVELLRARGIEDETIVVVTSDHGEAFGDHDRFLHGNSFYEELLHVPLLMAGPGLPSGARVAARVPSIDVMPTLCELMDAPCMPDVDGESLLPLIAGERGNGDRVLYATAPMRQEHGLRDVLIEGDYKLITLVDGIELYDLSRDPEERANLADAHPEVVRRMQETLVELRQRNEARRQRNMASLTDDEREETMKGTLEQMRALGYIE